jgi:hypothetical protein
MSTIKPSKDELMKAVADVLDEAIETYERLEKMDGIDGAQEIPDPSRSGQTGTTDSMGADGGIQGGAEPAPPKGNADTKADGVKGPSEAVLKDEDTNPFASKDKDKDEDEDEDEDEKKKKEKKDKDDKDMETFKSMAKSLEARGLIKGESIQKSEAATPVAAPYSKIEELKKSFSDSVEALTKQMAAIADKVEKIAAAPAAPRRGLSGATPLRKSDEAQATKPAFTKLEALDKLVELRKSGDSRIDTGLINRVELGKLVSSDIERLTNILG